MNLSEARDALAAAVSTLVGVTCVSHPVPGNLRTGDAFVTVGRRTQSEFTSHFQVLSAFVILGTDERKADLLLDELSGPLLDCVSDLYAGDVSVEPQSILTGTAPQASVYALALSVTLELS